MGTAITTRRGQTAGASKFQLLNQIAELWPDLVPSDLFLNSLARVLLIITRVNAQ